MTSDRMGPSPLRPKRHSFFLKKRQPFVELAASGFCRLAMTNGQGGTVYTETDNRMCKQEHREVKLNLIYISALKWPMICWLSDKFFFKEDD